MEGRLRRYKEGREDWGDSYSKVFPEGLSVMRTFCSSVIQYDNHWVHMTIGHLIFFIFNLTFFFKELHMICVYNTGQGQWRADKEGST